MSGSDRSREHNSLMTDPTNTGPRYPNQQLRSVALETFFPGRLGLYAALGRVQEAVESRLPNLFVPNVNPGEASALRPFQMRDSGQERSLAVAVNQASYVAFKYRGHETFAAEAIPVLQSTLEMVGVEKLNKVVYRYENELGFARDDDGTLAIARAFPGILTRVLGDGELAGPVRSVNAAYEHGWERHGLKGVRGFHARNEESAGMQVFRITVFGAVEDCHRDDLPRATSEAHRTGIDLFESLISDSFRDFISSSGEEE